MICPKCKSSLGTADTVHNNKENETYRRRLCKRCGYSFYTVEYEVVQNKRFEMDWADNYRKYNKKERKETKK